MSDRTIEKIMVDIKQRMKDSPVEVATFEMEFIIDKNKTENFVKTLKGRMKEAFDEEGIKFLWVSKR